jgi:hypothetical protein
MATATEAAGAARWAQALSEAADAMLWAGTIKAAATSIHSLN